MSAIVCNHVGVAYPPRRAPTLKEWALNRARNTETKRFEALADISLSIAESEAFGIIGRNGAGKSTLLRLIAGIVPPTSGEVLTRGTVAPIIEIGTGFDGELSGRENIFFNGSLLGRSRAFMRAREEEIVEFADISDFIDAPLRTYSTGMIARLAFSIATTVEADIILLDEVLAVGDAAFREKCDDRIRHFHATGATVVIVAHDLDTVRQLCSRVAWLDHGRLNAIGPAADVIDAYQRGLHAVPELSVGSGLKT